MTRPASAKYLKKKKQRKRLKKSLVKGIKIFLKKKKPKRENMVGSTKKISHKMTNKSYLSIEKEIMKCEKLTEIRFRFLAVRVKMG